MSSEDSPQPWKHEKTHIRGFATAPGLNRVPRRLRQVATNGRAMHDWIRKDAGGRAGCEPTDRDAREL